MLILSAGMPKSGSAYLYKTMNTILFETGNTDVPQIKTKHLKDVLPANNTRLPIIPQILSKSADDFTFLANYLFDLGYETVNWNLGCPFPQVADALRGRREVTGTSRSRAYRTVSPVFSSFLYS